MKNIIALLTVACFVALGIVPTLQAQDLQTGTWTGTVIPPDGQVIEVTYLVESVNDTLKVTITSPMGTHPIHNITVGEANITFSWTAGNTDLDCDLKRQDDGRYAGECVDAGGDPGQLTMIPPKEDDQEEHP